MKLDEIVRNTKAKEDIGIRYVNTWVREEEIKRAASEEGPAEGVTEQRVYTEIERKRADDTEKKLKAANERIAQLEAENTGKK